MNSHYVLLILLRTFIIIFQDSFSAKSSGRKTVLHHCWIKHEVLYLLSVNESGDSRKSTKQLQQMWWRTLYLETFKYCAYNNNAFPKCHTTWCTEKSMPMLKKAQEKYNSLLFIVATLLLPQ